MNLLINILWLFLLLIISKQIIPQYVEGKLNQNLALVAALYLGSVIYRVSVNYYFQKTDTIKNVFMEGLYRTILVIVGIVSVNYIISNPETVEKYGLTIPDMNNYTSTAVSLVPFLLSKALLSPDV